MQIFAEQPDQGTPGRDILTSVFAKLFVSKPVLLVIISCDSDLSKEKDIRGVKKKGKR